MLSKDENVGFTKIKERKVILLQNASQSIKSSALLIFLREDLLFPSKVEKLPLLCTTLTLWIIP